MVDEVSCGTAVDDNSGFDNFHTCGEFLRDPYSSLIQECYEYMIEATKIMLKQLSVLKTLLIRFKGGGGF